MTVELDGRRKTLLELNLKSWDGEYHYPIEHKLDSSLKKNTTFIKKIKISLNQESYDQILKDIKTITIEKYLSEVITSLVEGLCKVSKNDEILASMEIVSALHQRFGKVFTSELFDQILIYILNPQDGDEMDEKFENSRLIRQKNLLKLIGEFYIIGIFRTSSDFLNEIEPKFIKIYNLDKRRNEPILTLNLKYLLNFNLEKGRTLSMVQSFLKRFNHLIFNDNNDLIKSDTKHVLKQIFIIYTEAVMNVLGNLKKQVHRLEVRNRKASIRTGRILEDQQQELISTQSLLDSFKVAAEFLSPLVNVPIPENIIYEQDEEEDSGIELVKQNTINEEELNGVWEDTKEKNFYTVIPSLGELLDAYQDNKGDTSQAFKDGEKIQEFLDKLEDVRSNNLEQLVVEFNNLNLNNKATKNRIMRFFIETSTLNNLKYYTRFLKINELNLSDLIEELINYLDKGFRSQLHHNKLNVKNILFFVEMIKFKMIPIHTIFHKIRNLTLNITSTNNIEILSVFYENVGRFLLNDSEYKSLMKEMMELLKEKSKQSSLTVNEKLAINNLLITVEPPATRVLSLRENSKLSQKQQFIIKIIQSELNIKSLPIVAKLLKKGLAEFTEEEIQTLLNCFSRPDLINYDNIPALAKLLNFFSDKHKKLVVITIDSIIENIIRGLELNDFRMNRSRMSQVKYIADLYNSKVINFKLINDILYRILCFGHPNNQPLPNNWDIYIDLPNNFFRIQLCCLLLLSLDSIFIDTDITKKKASNRAALIKKRNNLNKDLLGVFITFLQYYLYCKDLPYPVEVNFKLNDVFNKFKSIPTVKRYDTIQEVVKRLSESVTTKQTAESELDEEEEEEEEVESRRGGNEFSDEEEDEVDLADNQSDEGSDDENDDNNSGEESEENEEEEVEDNDSIISEEDQIINDLERIRIEADKKFQEDLDKEFQKIMNESYGSASQHSTSIQHGGSQRLSSGLSRRILPVPEKLLTAENDDENSLETEGKVKFKFLSKKDGKINQIKPLNLPQNNQFAESVLKEKENRRKDRERIMLLANKDYD
ncbi:NMD2 [Candida pseudojiufengensis]|uniref:NMD2 n=1 Tax=Candida pseudojiufengensis TaxID=497109 RepID=UPI002224ED85|nr:NMD2 [Candida pseudojiufengensis]KAI5964772.1 NMD2 [Candida pseudojiufengensis]